MGLVAAKATGQTGTAVAGTTIDVALDLGGLTPVVFWVRMIGRTETTNAVGSGQCVISRGFGVSASSRRCLAGETNNGVSPTQGDRVMRNDAILASISNAGVINGRLDVNAVSANSIQFIVDQQFSTNYAFEVEALAGSDITNAACVTWTHAAGTGNQDVTTVGFDGARYVESMSDSRSSDDNAAGALLAFYYGRAYVPDAANSLTSTINFDNVSPSDSAAYANDSEHLTYYASTSATIGRFSVTAAVAGGFRINTVETNGGSRIVYSLVLAGSFLCKMGSAQTQTGTSNFTISPGFTPILSFVDSHCRAESAADTPDASAKISCGSFLGQFGHAQTAMGYSDMDAVSPAQVDTAVRYNAVYVNTTGAGAEQGVMAVTTPAAMVRDDVTFVMLDPDPSQAQFTWACFGSSAPTAGSTFVGDVYHLGYGGASGTFSLSMPNLLAAGERVKIVRISGAGAQEPADGAPASSIGEGDIIASYGVGVWSGAQIAYANFVDTGAATSDAGHSRAPGFIYSEIDATGAQTGAMKWIPTNAAGDLTLTVTDAFAHTQSLTIECWGGSAITDAAVIGFSRTTGTGSLAVTTGMLARYLETLNGQLAAGTDAAVDASFSLGRCWVPTLDQHVVSYASDDAAAATDAASYGVSGEVIADITPTGGGAVGGRVAVTAADATSVTLNRIESGATTQCHMLVVAGTFQGALGAFQTRTDSANFGPGASSFAHKAESLWSVNSPTSTADTSTNSAALSIGAYASSQESATALEDFDGADPTLCTVGYASNGVYINAFAGVIAGRVSDGTFSISSGDDDTNYVFYAFLGDQASSSANMAMQTPRSWLNRNLVRGY